MRIALRTGAGRGAIELAGTQGQYSASELFDKEMFYELTPNLTVPGHAIPGLRQGKPRINIDDSYRQDATHFYRLLSALLLLPTPTRDFKKTSGSVLYRGKYSMTVIKIDVVAVEPHRSVVRPTEILLESIQGFKERIDFIERVSRIIRVWDASRSIDSELANLLRKHEQAFYDIPVSHTECEKIAKRIYKYLDASHDSLKNIESRLGSDEVIEIEVLPPSIVTKDFGIHDKITQKAAQIENIRKWRKVAVRGAAGVEFRRNIKYLYQERCLFTGQRLPKLNSISSSGVDAAHILPWASHKINTPDNGICLSKQGHWAFDSGVIKFFFDHSVNQYVISIPEKVRLEARKTDFSLDAFEAITGSIPRERLPSDTQYWPNPSNLDEFNEIMFA